MRTLSFAAAIVSSFAVWELASRGGETTLLIASVTAAVLAFLGALLPTRRAPGRTSSLSPDYAPMIAPAPPADFLSASHSTPRSAALTSEQRTSAIRNVREHRKNDAVRDVKRWTGLGTKEARDLVERLERGL